jgi:hypothetical protein
MYNISLFWIDTINTQCTMNNSNKNFKNKKWVYTFILCPKGMDNLPETKGLFGGIITRF